MITTRGAPAPSVPSTAERDAEAVADEAAQPEPEAVVVRFAGDSGDGMQLTGGQFTLSTALAGNDLATFPDFPAEIRAPQGTTFGVSAFQINFGSTAIDTAGDQPDVLVAMNPAALKANLGALPRGGTLIVDADDRRPRKRPHHVPTSGLGHPRAHDADRPLEQHDDGCGHRLGRHRDGQRRTQTAQPRETRTRRPPSGSGRSWKPAPCS